MLEIRLIRSNYEKQQVGCLLEKGSEEFNPTLESREMSGENIYQKAYDNTTVFWGAFLNDLLVGCVAYKKPDNEMSLLYVDREYRRKYPITSLMLNTMYRDLLHVMGVRSIVLDTWADSPISEWCSNNCIEQWIELDSPKRNGGTNYWYKIQLAPVVHKYWEDDIL